MATKNVTIQSATEVLLIQNVLLKINNTEQKWVAGQTFSGVQIIFDPETQTLELTLPKSRAQSDITKLAIGDFTGIYSKHNNKSDKYEIQFSVTAERLRKIGKPIVRRELTSVFDAIWTDLGEA